MKKFSLIAFLYFGALSMLIMSVHYFQGPDAGILKAKAVASSSLYLALFYTHITGGLVGISIGPFQFIKRFRLTFPMAHKTIGMVYLMAIFSSGLTGLCIAPFAMGGPSAQLAFSYWLWSGLALRHKPSGSYGRGNIRRMVNG